MVPRTVREAREELDSLIAERNSWIDRNGVTGQGLADILRGYDSRIRDAEITYTVNLLESLDSSSTRMVRLTWVLVGLTIVLACLTAVLILEHA
jgi:CHASE3 domain sensor protein